MENHVKDVPVSEDQYHKFDSDIFQITKIQIGFSLTDGQKKELLEVVGKIEAARQESSLSETDRQKLLATIADCGLELPAASAQAAQHRSTQNVKKRSVKDKGR